LSNLRYDAQLSPFGDDRALHGAVDGIRERYGYEAVQLALTMSR
jgi:hypothetical protein